MFCLPLSWTSFRVQQCWKYLLCITFWDLGYLQFLALFSFIVKCPLFISFLGNQNIVNNRGSFFLPVLFIVKDTAETGFSPGSSYSAQSHLQFPLSFSSRSCTLTPQWYSMSTLPGSPSYSHTTREWVANGAKQKYFLFQPFDKADFETCSVPYTLPTLHDTPYSTLHFECYSMLYLIDLTSYAYAPYMLHLKVPYNYRQPARRHPTDPHQHQRFPPREICKVVPSYLRSWRQ